MAHCYTLPINERRHGHDAVTVHADAVSDENDAVEEEEEEEEQGITERESPRAKSLSPVRGDRKSSSSESECSDDEKQEEVSKDVIRRVWLVFGKSITHKHPPDEVEKQTGWVDGVISIDAMIRDDPERQYRRRMATATSMGLYVIYTNHVAQGSNSTYSADINTDMFWMDLPRRLRATDRIAIVELQDMEDVKFDPLTKEARLRTMTDFLQKHMDNKTHSLFIAHRDEDYLSLMADRWTRTPEFNANYDFIYNAWRNTTCTEPDRIHRWREKHIVKLDPSRGTSCIEIEVTPNDLLYRATCWNPESDISKAERRAAKMYNPFVPLKIMRYFNKTHTEWVSRYDGRYSGSDSEPDEP